MGKDSKKEDDREEQKGDEHHDFSNGSETEDKDVQLIKRDFRLLSKRKRKAYINVTPQDKHSSEWVGVQVTNPPATTIRKSETPLAAPSTVTTRIIKRLPQPPPSAKTLERVEDELRKRYKKIRINAPSAGENKNSATEPAAQMKVTRNKDAQYPRSLSIADEKQEERVAQEEENPGGERNDVSGDGCNSSQRPRLKPKSPFRKNPQYSSASGSSSPDSVEKSGRSQGGHDGTDGKEVSASESKSSGDERDNRPLPNDYREEFRMRYKQLSRQRKTQATEIMRRRGRTKRTLTGHMPKRIIPTINDSIWRLQYETGCLPGGPNKFLAPKRQDFDVCESRDRAGYIGIGLLAKKLGYHVKEMKSLGGYGIEVETDDRLEMSWCPPDSEYSRVIATKLPSNSGLWLVDMERGFEYDGTPPFQMPSWRTAGPFESIEDAVAEAKKQVGVDRGWEWERVAMDGAFEIKTDNATGWEGHWNPPGHEYSHVTVKMVGWPSSRLEYACSCEYGYWRKAFGLESSGMAKDKVNRVEWNEAS